MLAEEMQECMRSDMLHFFIRKGKRIKLCNEWNSISFGPASFPFLPFFFPPPNMQTPCLYDKVYSVPAENKKRLNPGLSERCGK